MELKDFVVTPIVLLIVYVIAYIARPYVSDEITSKYFIPALTVKIIGAICVGLVYQFYYGGGDTFAYHTHGSRWIWLAFNDDVEKGVKMLLTNGDYEGVYNYAKHIWYYRDEHSYFLIKIVAVVDLITFSTYSATAVLFASISFTGMWALFDVFYSKYPQLNRWFALAIFFIPSVFFWGSGILKDSVTMGGLGWLTYSCYQLFLKKNLSLLHILTALLSGWLILNIKVYILLSFLPSLILWFFVDNIGKVRSLFARLLIAPLMLGIALAIAYFAVNGVGKKNSKYAIENIASTAQITAYDIRYGWGARLGDNSGYTLGELDGSFGSMIRLTPEAINVSLFRPYLWEVRNPLMLLSSLESLFMLILTLWMLWKFGLINFFKNLVKPDVLFCVSFSIVFAFAVGISTYNFGTLARYKIPLIPFYVIGMLIASRQDKGLDFVEK